MTSALQAKKKSGVMKPNKSENTICLAGLKRLGRLLDGIRRPSAILTFTVKKTKTRYKLQNHGLFSYWVCGKGGQGEGDHIRQFGCPFASFGIDLMGERGDREMFWDGFDRGKGRRRAKEKLGDS